MEEKNSQNLVFTKSAVIRSITTLLTEQRHEHLSGYLAVLRAKVSKPSEPVKSSDITDLYDRYLRVDGAPANTPYLQAFRSRGKGLVLFNKNVAGSYAPSNRRANGAFFEVIEVKGEGRTTKYDLKPNHADAALTHLFQGTKLPITALTAFFYRDYGFQLESPDPASIVNLFRLEFGLSRDVPSQQLLFDALFSDDSSSYTSSDVSGLSESLHG